MLEAAHSSSETSATEKHVASIQAETTDGDNTSLRNVGKNRRDVLHPYTWILKMEAAHFSSETSA
jgi:hypothetical protein